ncbi:hypothetical protein CORC01_13673, partial [Colletotrichum orchidophilum]
TKQQPPLALIYCAFTLSYAIRIPRFSTLSSLFPMPLLHKSHFMSVGDPITRRAVVKSMGEEGPWGCCDGLGPFAPGRSHHHASSWKANHPLTHSLSHHLQDVPRLRPCSLICISSTISFGPGRTIPLPAPLDGSLTIQDTPTLTSLDPSHDPAARRPSFEEMALIHWLEPFLVGNLVSHSFSKQRDPRDDLLSPGSR